MKERKRSPMSQTVTFRELEDFKQEFKDWMLANFATKQDFTGLSQRVDRLEKKVDQLEDKMLVGFDKAFGMIETMKQEEALQISE